MAELAAGDRETLAALAIKVGAEKWAIHCRNPEWIKKAEARAAVRAAKIWAQYPGDPSAQRMMEAFHGGHPVAIDEQPPGEIDRSVRYPDGTVYRCSELGMFDRAWSRLKGDT